MISKKSNPKSNAKESVAEIPEAVNEPEEDSEEERQLEQEEMIDKVAYETLPGMVKTKIVSNLMR